MSDRITRAPGKVTKLKPGTPHRNGRYGGKRPGAGRPPGAVRRLTMEAIEQARTSGELPLDYMLRVMRDPKADKDRRDRMAQAAAPYLHARLTKNEHTGPGGGPLLGKLVVEFD